MGGGTQNVFYFMELCPGDGFPAGYLLVSVVAWGEHAAEDSDARFVLVFTGEGRLRHAGGG